MIVSAAKMTDSAAKITVLAAQGVVHARSVGCSSH